MHELRTHLAEDEYMELLSEMIPRGYRLFVLEDDGEMMALAGIGRGTNLYYGRYVWVYDLVTRADVRSKGYGLALLSRVEEMARADRCDTLALASGLQRADAHRFYADKVGMKRMSYSFVKGL